VNLDDEEIEDQKEKVEYARDSPISSYESQDNIFKLNFQSEYKI